MIVQSSDAESVAKTLSEHIVNHVKVVGHVVERVGKWDYIDLTVTAGELYCL